MSNGEARISVLRAVLLRSETLDSLATDFCQSLVDEGGFDLAWLEWTGSTLLSSISTTCHTSPRFELITQRLQEGGDLRPFLKQVRERGQPATIEAVDSKQSKALLVAFPLQPENQFRGWLVVGMGEVSEASQLDWGWMGPLVGEAARMMSRHARSQALEQQVEELEQLRGISELLASGAEVSEILTEIVSRAAELLQGDGGGLYLVQEGAETLRCVVSLNTVEDFTGTDLKFGEGAAGSVAQTGKPLIIDDYTLWEGHARVFSHGEPFHAMISAPLIWQGVVNGVIHVLRSRGSNPFTHADLERLELFSHQAAVLVENVRLLGALTVRATELDRLNAMTRAALQAGDVDQLAEQVTSQLAELYGGKRCIISFWDRERKLPRSALVDSLELRFKALALEEGARTLTRTVLEAGRPLVVQDPANSKWVAPQIGALFEAQTVLAVPMILEGEWFGAILVTFENTRNFSKADLQFAEQAAGQVALALAKLQSLERERFRIRELEAVHEASLNLASNLELTVVLNSILTSALSLVAADDAHIFLYDGNVLRFGAAQWSNDENPEIYAEPRQEGLTYNVARSGKRIVVPDANQDPLFTEWRWGGAIAGLPLKIQDRVVGVMNVAWHEPHQFMEPELRALELLADQAALMVQNASLYENVVKERRSVQLVYGLAQELANTLDPVEILERAVTLTAAHLGARAGEAFTYDPVTGLLNLQAASHSESIPIEDLAQKQQLMYGEGLVGWVAEHRMPILVDDVKVDRRWKEIPGLDEDARAMVCAPLTSGGALLGVISFLHDEVDAFTVEHLDLLIAIARQVSLALSNAESYRKIERRLTEFTALRQVLDVVNRRLEMQALLQEVVHQVGTVLGFPVVEIYMVEEQDLVLGAAFGGPRDTSTHIPISMGIIGRVARSSKAAYVSDVSQDPDYIVGIHNTRSEIAVPLRKEDVVIGVLNVESPGVRSLTDDDMQLLSVLADQLSIAVENAALYERLRSHAVSLEDTVQARTAELAEALKQARAAEQLKSQFVSDVSHELRTPLSNIRLYLDLMRRGRTERYEAYLRTLDRETERLVVLIEDLLTISRMEAGSIIPQPVELDLNRLAQGLVEDRQRLFADRGLTLQVGLGGSLPRVNADERMISQVVANLMTNALNYTPAGGTVRLATKAESDHQGRRWVVISVSDNGLGIAKEEQAHIFERFYRGSASRQMGTPGTGLGLSICKEVVERHGGEIKLQSKLKKGSTFSVWLPLNHQATRPR
jgi:signal transduction histidine kinase